MTSVLGNDYFSRLKPPLLNSGLEIHDAGTRCVSRFSREKLTCR